MILYHFTSKHYVDAIRDHGLLSPAEKLKRGAPVIGIKNDGSIIDVRDRYQPPVPAFPKESELVWLTRQPEPVDGDPWSQDVRITVDVEDARAWRTAADKYGVPTWWRTVLKRAAASSERDWYVIEGFIPPEHITEIEVLT